MSTEVQNQSPEAPKTEAPKAETKPEQKADPKPEAKSEAKGDDAYVASLRSIQSENVRLGEELKGRESKISTLEKELSGLKAQVDLFQKREREGSILSKIRAQIPHAGDLELRGVLAALHESGKLDRFSEDSESTARKALEMIKTDAPNLLRAPMGPGGSAAAPPTAPGVARVKSLIWGG